MELKGNQQGNPQFYEDGPVGPLKKQSLTPPCGDEVGPFLLSLISWVSACMQRNSPRSTATSTAGTWMIHHSQVPGKPSSPIDRVDWPKIGPRKVLGVFARGFFGAKLISWEGVFLDLA